MTKTEQKIIEALKAGRVCEVSVTRKTTTNVRRFEACESLIAQGLAVLVDRGSERGTYRTSLPGGKVLHQTEVTRWIVIEASR